MRLRWIFAFALTGAGAASGCASFFHLEDYSTRAADGASDPATDETGDATEVPEDGPDGADGATTTGPDAVTPPECVTNAECTAKATAEGPIDAGIADGAADATVADAQPFDGRLDGGIVPAVCLKASGTCARLLTTDCRSLYGDYLDDDAILLGTFFVTSGASAGSNVPRQQAAVLAAEEINSPIAGGGLPPLVHGGSPRPLVVLQCDPSADSLRTARHLVDELHVPAVVGPNAAQDVLDVTQQVSAKGGTLLMSPVSLASPISNLVDNGLTWRDVASDDQRAKLLIEQINAIEAMLHATRGGTLKLGVVYRTDALGLSARDSISGKLMFNGHFISDPVNATSVSIDHYDDPNDLHAQSVIVAKYAALNPDIVFVTAQEQVAGLVIPLEQALTAADAGAKRPYYVCTDAAKAKGLLTGATAANVPPDFRARVRGIGVRPDTSSAPVFAAFNTAFTARYGSNPGTSGMGTSYDAMYAIAYAIAATPTMPVTGASVAQGLRMLGAGETFTVGESQASIAFQRLAAGTSIALRGTFSSMVWDANGDIVGGTVEAWCVGAPGGNVSFGSSGLTMDVGTQSIAGTYVQCP